MESRKVVCGLTDLARKIIDGSVANSRRISQLSRTSKGMLFQVNGGKGVVGYGRKGAVSDHNTTCVDFPTVLLSV